MSNHYSVALITLVLFIPLSRQNGYKILGNSVFYVSYVSILEMGNVGSNRICRFTT